MNYLVFCMCGHGLDRHGSDGCEGDGRMPCPCRKDQGAALDTAIEDARSHPWGPAPGAAEPALAGPRSA